MAIRKASSALTERVSGLVGVTPNNLSGLKGLLNSLRKDAGVRITFAGKDRSAYDDVALREYLTGIELSVNDLAQLGLLLASHNGALPVEEGREAEIPLEDLVAFSRAWGDQKLRDKITEVVGFYAVITAAKQAEITLTLEGKDITAAAGKRAVAVETFLSVVRRVGSGIFGIVRLAEDFSGWEELFMTGAKAANQTSFDVVEIFRQIS